MTPLSTLGDFMTCDWGVTFREPDLIDIWISIGIASFGGFLEDTNELKGAAYWVYNPNMKANPNANL